MSTKTPATAADFKRWEEKAAGMTDAALAWSIKDCVEAQAAMRGHDPIAENWYRDEMLTLINERMRRAGEKPAPIAKPAKPAPTEAQRAAAWKRAAAREKRETIEAHGVRGALSTSWRRRFRDATHLNEWAAKNDAAVLGVRQIDEAT